MTPKRNCSMDKNWLDGWHVTPAGSQNYGFLDGIRGLAILMVVACHVLYVNPQASDGLRFVFGLFSAGTCGVTVFFVLSGFLISLPFWKCKSKGAELNLLRYAARRFWKIAPPLILSLVILTPAYIYFYGNRDLYLHTAWQWLTGQAFFIPVSGKLNPVMWSLIVEVHFYIIIPFVFLLLKRVSYRATVIFMTLGFLLIPFVARHFYLMQDHGFSLHPLIQVRFPSKLDAFSVGILIAGIHARNALPVVFARFAPLGFLGIALSLIWSSYLSLQANPSKLLVDLNHVIVLVSSGLLLSFICHPSAAKKWLLDSSLLKWLGLVSYEWYLFHQAAFFFTWAYLGNSDGDLWIYFLRVAIPTLGSLFLAAIVYRFFSLPILIKTRVK